MITGHTGFKGTWLTLLLESLEIPCVGFSLEEKGDSLYARSNRKGAIPEGFGDIRNRELLEAFVREYKPGAVIHLAAESLVLTSYLKPIDTFETNVLGTANLLDICCRDKNIKSVVVATTDKVYRNENLGKYFVETDPLEGVDPYSTSKVATESVVKSWQGLAPSFGSCKISAARAGNVIGGGDMSENRLIPDIIRSVITKQPMKLRNPDSTRPWQHVLDPLHGYLKLTVALLQGETCPAINFGPSGQNLSVIQLTNIASEFFPQELILQKISIENSPYEARNLGLSSKLAREILNWNPFWGQEIAIKDTMLWWKSVLNSEAPEKACRKDIEKVLSEIA